MNSFPGRYLKGFLVLWPCMILITMAACGTLEVGVEHPPARDERFQQTISAIQSANASLATMIANPGQSESIMPTLSQQTTVAASLTPTLEPSTSTPTPTRTPGPPRFASLYFSTQPDGPPQRFFVAGIQRIYAIWNYENMNVGMVVHRIWEKDGELWSDRYETWDLPKYGAEGVKKDTFIYDFDYGLQAGEYTFSLDINGVRQTFGEGEAAQPSVRFWVIKGEIQAPIVSPNRTYSISIQGGGRLIIRDPDGNFRDLVVTNEISFIVWFPDNRHIAYADRDRTKQIDLNSDLGITHQLWILDVVTGERYIIGTADENFHHPLISPNGHYLAVLSGNTFNEGCHASPLLMFIELDQELHRKAFYEVNGFSGLPFSSRTDVSIYPNDPQRTGSWEDENTFVTYLRWTCIENDNQTDGIYLLRLDKMQAQRLPNQ